MNDNAREIVRDQTDADGPAVRELLTEAFGRTEVAELSERLHQIGGFGARLVAEQDGQVIGQVQLSRSWVDAPTHLVEVLVLSPLGVLRSHQRQGIGSALVRAAVARAEQLGASALFLEGSPAYYSRFGFEPGQGRGFVRPSVRIPEPAFQVITMPTWRPWMTGALVYADVFWQLDCVGLRD